MDACPQCGAALTGEYCAACGQRRIHPRSETLPGFVHAALAAVSPANGRALVSLRDLIMRPGLLTRAYIDGRRRSYLPPLQLFLLCNLVFFVISGLTGNRMFTQPLTSHVELQVYSPVARDMVRAKMTGDRAPDYNQLVQRFDLISDHYARALVIVMVPLIALVVGLLQYGRGPAMHHLVFALHYMAFALLFYLVEFLVLFRVGSLFGWWATDDVFVLSAMLAQTAYLAFAFRRAYGERIAAAVLKGAVASFAAIVIMQVYRFILFVVALNAA